tara:strand:- start:6352 stop:7056 length:705 start_codon:yes stop_codon:yes gene_type:complete
MAISIFGTKASNTDLVTKETSTGNVDLGSGTLTSTGTITGNLFSGSGASLTALQSAQLTGALPAIDGSALTGISSIGTIVKMSAYEHTGTASGSGAFSSIGVAATITPASTSNKILLFVTGTIGTDKNTVAARFTENNAAVGIGDPSGSRPRASFKIRGPHDNNHSALFAGSCILSPNSTSALTYRVEFQAESNGTWYLNRSWNDNNSTDASHSRASTYLYAIELAGSNTTITT